MNQSFEEKDTNTWDERDVSEFLLFNQCATYCDVFLSQVIKLLLMCVFCIHLIKNYFQNIDGKKLLNLTKGEIIHMTGNKVGPSLKIFDLIQKLKNNSKRKKYL